VPGDLTAHTETLLKFIGCSTLGDALAVDPDELLALPRGEPAFKELMLSLDSMEIF
jgi:hypothetical protein